MSCIFCLDDTHTAHSPSVSVCYAQPSLTLSNPQTFSPVPAPSHTTYSRPSHPSLSSPNIFSSRRYSCWRFWPISPPNTQLLPETSQGLKFNQWLTHEWPAHVFHQIMEHTALSACACVCVCAKHGPARIKRDCRHVLWTKATWNEAQLCNSILNDTNSSSYWKRLFSLDDEAWPLTMNVKRSADHCITKAALHGCKLTELEILNNFLEYFSFFCTVFVVQYSKVNNY